MRCLVACSFLLAVCGPASAQDKKGKVPGPKRAAQKAKATVLKYLKGRALKRLTKVEQDPHNKEFKRKAKDRRAKYVLVESAVRRAEWGYLPKAYQALFKRREFVPWFRPGNSPPIVDTYKIRSVVVCRDCVMVDVDYTPARPFAYYQDKSKDWIYKRPSRSLREVLVRQGGKYVFSRRWVPAPNRKKNAGAKGDAAAVEGELLVEHPWWEGTISVNAMLSKCVGLRVKAQGSKSARQAAGALERAVEEMRRFLAQAEVADVGRVVEVEDGWVRVRSGWLECRVFVPSAEASRRSEFYKGLKKGDLVVFRCAFEAENATDFTPQERSDGKSTVERWAEK